MKKLFLILSLFSLCFGVDVKQGATTPAATFTTFNQRVTQVGFSDFETHYQNATLPVSGKLQVPATFKASMLGNSKFTSYNNTSHDTLEFLGGGWKFSAGCFGDSLTVLFPSTVSEVIPEWWVNTLTGGIQEALNSLRGAGTVRLSKQYNTTATIYMNKDGQHLLGTGNRKAVINYNPPSGTGTAIEIRKGALVIYDVSIKDVRITTTENTGKKTAVDFMDVSLLKIDRLSIQHFTGSQSVGIRSRGREATEISGVFIDADIPIQISKNPNPFDTANPNATIDCNEIIFRDTYLIGSDPTQALVLCDTNLTITGMIWEGYNAWVHGKYGFYWNNKRNVASYPIIFRNIWREQGDDSSGYIFYIKNDATSSIYSLQFDNVNGGDSDPPGLGGIGGFFIRGAQNVTFKNINYTSAIKNALNVDSTVISMNLDQFKANSGSKAVLTGQRLVAAFNKAASGSPFANTAWYVAQTQNIANFGQSKTTQQTYVSEPVSQYIGLRNQKILDILSSTDSTKIALGASSTGARLYTYSNHPLILGANNSDYWTVGTSGLLSGNRAQLNFQGIGVVPDTNRLLYIKNVLFNNASVDRYGFRLQLQKTAGTSNYQDDFYGRYEDITFSQGSGEIGTFGGDYTSARQDSGTIGAVGNAKNAYVLKKDLDLNFGTITGSGNAGEFDISQSTGHTITGKSNVLYLTSDWAGTTPDTTAMIRMRNGSNTDFSIYQSGQGKVKFSDTGTTTSASTGAFMVPNGGITMKNFTINGSIYSALNLSGLNACLTSIGTRKATLVIIDTITLTAHDTIPLNIDLQFSGEGFVNGAYNFVVNKASNLPNRHLWDTATNVLFSSGAVSEMRVSWFGETETAINRAIASVQNYAEMPIKFKPNGVYEIPSSTGVVVSNRDGLNLDFCGATLKKTVTSGPVFTIKGCTHITISRVFIDGNNLLATIGFNFQSLQPTSGQGTSFIHCFDIYAQFCQTGILMCQQDIDGRDDAFDRSDFTGVRLYNNRYGVVCNSLNASSISMTNVDCGGSINPIHDVWIKRGGINFYQLITEGEIPADTGWAVRIRDGFIRWYGGHMENAIAADSCGMVWMEKQDTAFLNDDPYEILSTILSGIKIRGHGTAAVDSKCAKKSLIFMQDSCRPLSLINCELNVNGAYTSSSQKTIRISAKAGGFSSFGTKYMVSNATVFPFGTPHDTGNYGTISSYGDMTVYDSLTSQGVRPFVTHLAPITMKSTTKAVSNEFQNFYSQDLTGTSSKGQVIKFKFWKNGASIKDVGMIGAYKNDDVSEAGTVNIYANDSNGLVAKVYFDGVNKQVRFLDTGAATNQSICGMRIDGGYTAAKRCKILDATNSTNYANGALTLGGGLGVVGNINGNGIIKTEDATPSTSSSTGALVVPNGGIGAQQMTTDSLKIGSGSRITNIQLINDSLKITVGGVTKKFVATP